MPRQRPVALLQQPFRLPGQATPGPAYVQKSDRLELAIFQKQLYNAANFA